MIEYFPWSKSVLQNVIKDYYDRRFSILDLELGGECNCNCMYCDSPIRSEGILYSYDIVKEFIDQGSFKWLFICGLGEPTFNENYDMLIKLLKLCEFKNIKCSIFTNATNITKELSYYIDSTILYVLFKYDSVFDDISKKIVGNSHVGSYNSIFDEMSKMVNIKDGCTNIGASIVPTIYNEDILLQLVEKCIEKNIYPLVGSLENAGKAKSDFNSLSVSKSKLVFLKKKIDELINGCYKLPICPSTIGAIHISNKGDIVVDSKSGLSCSWFWMESPCMEILGNIHEHMSYTDICDRIINYRYKMKGKMPEKDADTVFGGCGGNIAELLSIIN